MAGRYDEQRFCAFCGKSQIQVQKLIAANLRDVYICDECVEVCMELLEEELAQQGPGNAGEIELKKRRRSRPFWISMRSVRKRRRKRLP